MEQYTPITIVVLIATVLVSIGGFSNNELFNKLKFNPYMVRHRNEWPRVITHAFVHVDWIHLFFNMFVLHSFGTNLELLFTEETIFTRLFPEIEFWGKAKGYFYFGLLYLGGILFATLPAFRKHSDNHQYNSVGASGAVSAVLFATILLLPTSSVRLFFIPVNIPAFVVGAGYLVYEHFQNKRGKSNVAHDAHISGALFGLVFMIVLNFRFISHFFSEVSLYFQSLFGG